MFRGRRRMHYGTTLIFTCPICQETNIFPVRCIRRCVNPNTCKHFQGFGLEGRVPKRPYFERT